jgi:outer membrane lipoprotein-sorting protein
VDGIDCYVLVRRPKEKKDTQYSKHVQWVRKDNLLRYKVEYYDKKDKLLKTMYFDACELIDGIWTNTKLRVEKADGKSSTLVDWSKIKYNVGLKDEYFEHSNLHR